MAGALTFLLICCLLNGVLCEQFTVTLPKTIEVLKGSCVTIPCSFEITSTYQNDLDNTCKAIWKNIDENIYSSDNPKLTTTKEMTGDLTRKDCTTTFNNMHLDHTNDYYFRLHCDNPLKWTFQDVSVNILVKADPPSPTLTPSTLEVTEGTSVRLKCSAPAPCLSQPPTLTWTPRLGDSQETLQENQDKTKVVTSVLTFTASHLHHGKTISCAATYNKQDGSSSSSAGSVLTADISYSPKSTSVSVRPSGPVPEDTNVTLTCTSDAKPAVRSYTWYRADGGQETFIGTGQTLNIRASKLTAAFICMAENSLGAGRSNIRQIDVQFPPQILHSSVCTKTVSQVNCSCETVGNPSPVLHWNLDGLPVDHSDKFAISDELLNDTGVRSVITVSQPQWGDLSTLVCHSSNSLGAASQRFCVTSFEQQTSAGSQVQVTLPVFITTVVALLVLVCALLLVIRVQRIHHKLPESQCTGDTSAFAMDQLLTRSEGNEAPNTTEEDIYANTHGLRQGDITQPATTSEPNSTNLPSSGPNDAEEASKSSEKTNEDGSDVVYSTVNWRSKSRKKQEDSVDMVPPGTSYLEEERCIVGDMGRNFVSHALEMSLYEEVEPKTVKEEVECEYAQVKFKDKSAKSK